MLRVLLEALLVLTLGVGAGLAANATSDRGLDLGRNYFPASAGQAGGGAAPLTEPRATAPDGEPPRAAPRPPTRPTGRPADDSGEGPAGHGATATVEGEPGASDGAGALAARLAAKGLTGIGFEETRAAWEDPLREFGAILFVDAREEDAFLEGHIPGARPLDFYHPEAHLAALLPLLPGTSRIVVYCNGGACEDSESAALLLLGLGADPGAVRIYTGGISEWRDRGMPIEPGVPGAARDEASDG